MKRPQSEYLVGVILFMIAYSVLWLIAVEPPLEDAFISMQCARNLWNGEGLVFNPGEHVEAISNLLWTFLLALLGGSLGNYLIASKLLGYLMSGMTLFLVIHLTYKFTKNFWILAFTSGLLMLSPFFLTFSVYGLESPLQTLLFLSLLLSVVEKRWWMTGTVLGLISWCRPEGFFFLPPVFLLIGLWERKEVKWSKVLIPSLGLTALLLIFRLVYYQGVLPNTVYAKSIALVSDRYVYFDKLSRGFRHGIHFLFDGRFYLWFPALCFGALCCRKNFLLFNKQESTNTFTRAWRWALAIGSIQLLFILVSGGNVFFRYRFFSALYPLICLMAGWGLLVFEQKDRNKIHSVLIASLALLGTLYQVEYERSGRIYWNERLGALEHYSGFSDLIQDRFKTFGAVPSTLNAKLGFIVKDESEPGTLIATGQIGQIGFYGERPILDVVGLADHTIAHEGGSLEYFLERKPELFLLLGSSNITDSPNVGVYSGILGMDEFRKQYQWTRVYQSDPPTETFYWIERRKVSLEQAPREPDKYQVVTLSLR